MAKVDDKLNSDIRNYIDELPENHNFGEFDINYLGRYTGCIDAFISERLIDLVWDYMKTKFDALKYGNDVDNPYSVDIMHTNSGGGYILRYAPTPANLFAYNNDYYCYTISKALFSRQANKDNFTPIFGDISDYFIGKYFGDNRKYDIVFVQTDEDSDYYKIDDDKKYSSFNPLFYYTIRSTFFLKMGGYLCSILPKQEAKKMQSDYKKLQELFADNCFIEKIIQIEGSEYVALIIHRHKNI